MQNQETYYKYGFHWRTAKCLKAWMKWNQHVSLRVPQRHANGPTHLSHNYLSFLLLESCSGFLNRRIKLNATDTCSICCFQSTRLDLSQRTAYRGPTVLTVRSREKYSAICTHIDQEKQKWKKLWLSPTENITSTTIPREKTSNPAERNPHSI